MGGIISTIVRAPLVFGIPGYMTYKSITNNVTDAQQHWLKYWTVVGILMFLETLLGYVLFFVPGFNIFFTVLYVGMALPGSALSTRVYDLLAPVLAARAPMIDEKIEIIEQKMGENYPTVEPYYNSLLGGITKLVGDRSKTE